MDLIKQFCESEAYKAVKITDNANCESEFIRINQEKYNYLLNSKPHKSVKEDRNMITLNTHSNLMLPAIHHSSAPAKRNGHWRISQVDHFGVICSVCGYDAGLNPETGQVYIECPNCKAVNVKMYQK